MKRTAFTCCSLCEATCGIAVDLEGDRIVGIRGDDDDPMSRGHICPKAVALQDIHEDPDRLRGPLRRRGDRFEPVSWDEAFDEIGRRLVEIRREHGRDAVALYYGNPTAHTYTGLLSLLLLAKNLGSRNVYSANSVDARPRLLASTLLYGNQVAIPVPDVDRTDLLLVLGANPVVSNGSLMTAPGIARRLKALRARGGRLVVVDPRRTETAALADTHLFIRPGADALLLAAMIRTILVEGRAAPGRLASFVDGIDALRDAVSPFTPEAVAGPTGIAAADIVALARDFAAARTAVAYGRVGTCTQELGTAASWLLDALNVVTGNFDRPGGAMFARGAVDVPVLARRIGQGGRYDRWRTRVGGWPELNDEAPVVAMLEEMETPGQGQIRALITHAGNPVLSVPEGRRLDRALAGLDFVVAIDIYRNETARHAHFILPPTFGLEVERFPLLFQGLSVRNWARFSPPVLPKPDGALHDWEIINGLLSRLGRLGRAQAAAVRRLTPKGALRGLLRTGPYRLTMAKLEAAPHGLDLGPLEPRLPGLLDTPGRRVNLVQPVLLEELSRAQALLRAPADGSLRLIGRRTLRSNNSWMHNAPRLVRGPVRCTLRMCPDDARTRGLTDGQAVRLTSVRGSIDVPLQVSDEVMPGVVSLPHGWGHDREGAALSTASLRPGASINDVTDLGLCDRPSGTSALSGVPVTVTAAT